MLIVLLWAALAHAAPATIHAVVASDLRSVSGTVVGYLPGESALAALAMPSDDILLLRTFPGRPDSGESTVNCAGETCSFSTRLPRRFGDVGWTDRRSMRANAGWYPEPSAESPPRNWEVEVQLPVGAVGVLNGVVGTGTVRWSGECDRLSLAVLEAGTPVVQEFVAGGTVTFVGRRAARKVVREAVGAIVESEWPFSAPPQLVVAESSDRNRLATAGPGVLYLSDRAFRVSPGLGRFHLAAVRRAIYSAAAPLYSAWDREFVGTAISEGKAVPKVERLLGWAAWNPVIDQLLHDGTLPYYADLFDEAFPVATDPLLRRLGWIAPRAAALQLDDWGGPGAARSVGFTALEYESSAAGNHGGESSILAMAVLRGVPESMVQAWRLPERPSPDYQVVVEGKSIRVKRKSSDKRAVTADTGPAAPARVLAAPLPPAVGQPNSVAPGVVVEPASDSVPANVLVPPGESLPAARPLPVVIQVGDSRELWAPSATFSTFEVSDGRQRVIVDPDAHHDDPDRSNNRWPARWNVIATGWFDDVSATAGTFDLWADLVFRKSGDNRNVYLLGLEHDTQDLISTYLGYVRYLGTPLSRSVREHRFVVAAGPALLDPAFRPTDEGAVAVGGSAAYTWDTRPSAKVQVHGHRLSVSSGAGFVPGSEEQWASAGASYVQLLPAHPRHVFALRTRASWASGDVEHRLLTLGGSDAIRSVPATTWVGNERLIAQLEYRWAAFRDVSLPLGFGWMSELVFAPGVETGVSWRDGVADPATVIGVTAGVYTLIDVLGARPTLFGVSGGLPVYTSFARSGGPEVYLSFDYAY